MIRLPNHGTLNAGVNPVVITPVAGLGDMSLASRLAFTAFAGLLIAATPSEFTREELRQLEAERDAALRQLEALERAENASVRDVTNLESELIAAAMESRRREEQAAASELKLIDLDTRLISARGELVESHESLEQVMANLAISGRHHPPALISARSCAEFHLKVLAAASATRRACSTALSKSETPGSRATNSSPPVRAQTHFGPASDLNARATCNRIASPA